MQGVVYGLGSVSLLGGDICKSGLLNTVTLRGRRPSGARPFLGMQVGSWSRTGLNPEYVPTRHHCIVL